MRVVQIFPAVLWALLLNPFAEGQNRPAVRVSGECNDDMMRDRCDSESQRLVRELYGVPSIEELAASGAEIRRAFFVDGYARDIVAITFERRPGADPRVVVTARVADGAENGRRVEMSAPMSQRTWQGMLKETQYFDRTLAPLPPPPPEPGKEDGILVCLHPWVVTVEGADPSERPATRIRTEPSCGDKLAVDAAFSMAQRAYELLPQCNALSFDHYRNEATLLKFCALLEGDRIAAAQAMNQSSKLDEWILGERKAHDLRFLVCDDATLQWPGEAAEDGRDGAATSLVRLREGLYNWPVIVRVVGENANRVRVTGQLTRPSDKATAGFEQIWTRERGADFRLCEMRVEPFAAAKAK
jgi:hypothetical protein